ncbi:MAG: SLBB domain-containing protein [Lewinellaceae bacterium]|nr:SLBB domain-containing protein [Lewinellaceae bacterium]
MNRTRNLSIERIAVLPALLFLLLGVCAPAAVAQTPAETLQQQARAEIQRRGLDEAELRARLLQRGIDMDSITPEQLPQLQGAIEQVIAEMEADKAKKAAPAEENSSLTREQAEQIQQRVKQGASIEEALSEEVAQADSLPPAQVYGQHLFRDRSLAVFRTTNDIKPPDSYILSSGDVITISIFGPSQFDSRFEIGKDGYIQPSQMPKIFLKGLPLSQARELLRSRFGQFYRFAPEQFAVSLSTARSITVHIFGETINYGSFSLSAINTAFNALMAAGGPGDLGSVRNISVIRGKNSRRLDVYEFMNNPAVQYDFFLEDNDIIHVPVAERIIDIRGAVRRPFRYELTGNEQLLRLIEFAGGFSANAYREVLQVRRYTDDRQVLIDVNLRDLQAKGQDFALQNGDQVIVRSIPSAIENTASIEGAVELPGAYSLSETPRVSDLLKKGSLRPEARTDAAFLLRTNTDNTTRLIQINVTAILSAPGSAEDLALQPKDRLTVYAKGRYTDISSISVTGAVRDAVSNYPYTHDSSLTLQRAILLAGGLRPDASGIGLITRNEPGNIKELEYIEVDLAAAFDDPNSASNIVLHPFDRLEALSRSTYADTATIRVGGAVRRPGEFVYGQNMTLRDALLLAGGLKLEAARNRVDIFRIQIRENEPTRAIVATTQVDNDYVTAGGFNVLPYDEIVVRSVPEFEFQRFVDLQGEVRYPGRYALVSDNETLADLVRRAGGLSEEAFAEGARLYRSKEQRGYVVTDLDDAMRNYRSSHNHILKEGDVITVPKREDLVVINTANTRAGEVLVAPLIANGLINVAYTPGKRAGWFVKKYAAGFGEKARRSHVTVEQPNGKINRTVNLGLFKIYPKVTKGSVISVAARPPKAQKAQGEKKSVDWDKALTQILATVGTLATVLVAYAALKN